MVVFSFSHFHTRGPLHKVGHLAHGNRPDTNLGLRVLHGLSSIFPHTDVTESTAAALTNGDNETQEETKD